MTVDVVDVDARVHDLELRIPFEFGVTTVERLPHAVVRVDLAADGTTERGVSADHLFPKWFSKDPDLSVAEDLEALRTVVLHACEEAVSMSPSETVFDFWRRLYRRQEAWAGSTDYPPLVWGFGVSFLERAAIDAYCRATGRSFAGAVRENALGTRPGAIYDEVAGTEPADALPATPRHSLTVRHTVGAADPLTRDDLDPSGRVDDGLPQTLSEVVATYGVSRFKLKVEGDPAADAARLERIADVVDSRVADPAFTLDANEQYGSFDDLRELWRLIETRPALACVRDGLEFVEQPFPRESALSEHVGEALRAWDGPPVIVDESDSRPDSLKRALDRGYAGTSHKNCKGVFKSLVNVCLLERRRARTDRPVVFSAEDLTTVGPVALPQDLAVVATLGLPDAERNGHHYLRGLDGFPDPVGDAALDTLPSLYRRHDGGFPTLTVRDGSVDLSEVVAAPFGVPTVPDLAQFDRLRDHPFDA